MKKPFNYNLVFKFGCLPVKLLFDIIAVVSGLNNVNRQREFDFMHYFIIKIARDMKCHTNDLQFCIRFA